MPAGLSGLSDTELVVVTAQVISVMTANPAPYGVTPAEIAALGALRISFDGDLAAQMAAIAAAKAATATKEAARTPLVAALRTRRDMARASGATEAEMAALGLPSGGPPPPPTATIPMASVDTSERMRHTISWVDAATPGNKRRPRGAMGVEIYLKLDGPPPTDETQCTFLTVDSKTPYMAAYDGADAGKMAHYMLRWRMRDGTTGAWGETVSATITG